MNKPLKSTIDILVYSFFKLDKKKGILLVFLFCHLPIVRLQGLLAATTRPYSPGSASYYSSSLGIGLLSRDLKPAH